MGFANANYLADENIIEGHIEHNLIESFCLVPSSCSSSISNGCSMFSRPEFGAENLIQVCGPMVTGTADFRMHFLDGANQKICGSIHQELVLERVRPDQVDYSTTLTGWYDTPTEIIEARGYLVHLRQVGPGEIEGVLGYVVTAEDGRRLYVLSRRRYQYEGNHSLPTDEAMVYRILEMKRRIDDVDKTDIIDFRSQAYYLPFSGAALATA